MDVPIDHPDKDFWKDRYVSEYTFREKESHDLLGETIVIIFAEMANFSKTAEECVTEVDRMLYLLKNIGKMLHQPEWLQHEVYTRIFDACGSLSRSAKPVSAGSRPSSLQIIRYMA